MGYRKQARAPRYCFIHCSATPPKMKCTAKMIDGWHKGQGWPGISYAWFCRQDGTEEKGCPENVVAYHAGGKWNVDSFGICYEGGVNNSGVPADTRTPAQIEWMVAKCRDIVRRYPGIVFCAHYAVAQKACPSFDVEKFCKQYDLPYFDPRKPKKSIAASIFGGAGAAAANEMPDSPTRIGLLDNFDFEASISPVTNLLSGAAGANVPYWLGLGVKIALGGIAVATAYFAITRTIAQFNEWRYRRSNPKPAAADEMHGPGA